MSRATRREVLKVIATASAAAATGCAPSGGATHRASATPSTTRAVREPAFVSATPLGALWEIFEFDMDQIFGLNMQKSGLVDTMWDLIVNALGAAVVSFAGWRYIRQARRRHVDTWAARFIRRNRRWRKLRAARREA